MLGPISAHRHGGGGGSSSLTSGGNSAIFRSVKARKVAAVFLSLGYLAAVHCRVACAFSMPIAEAVESPHDGCHHEDGDQNDHDSKAPCCQHPGSVEALPPTDAAALAPQAVLSLFAILPQAGVAVTPFKPLALDQNHDPPPPSSEGFSPSSLSPRAPPAVLL